ncbi:TRAFs-binding domain-containing protein [Sphingobium aromaticiconvertens]|uniref:TRAFs-binding domain-containing protein n=1 Tax=Sphingobium aromaticiconvertens TaxID=365341 RepID=UPI003017EA45
MNLPILAQIRQIARAGDTLRAWRMFEGAGLVASEASDALSLKGKLLKDRALRSGNPERNSLLGEAQDAYLRSAGDRRATYPLINAATIAFLNGKNDHARLLAERVLSLLESREHEPETRYWLGATSAEAQLLLGNIDASRAALEQAVGTAPDAWEDHAATLQQLKQILDRMGEPAGIFDHLCPPPSLYFSGIIGLPNDEASTLQMLGAALDEIRPGVVFGALAAGADIVIAEMAMARGAQLHVVLPTTIDIFRATSVAQFGVQWAERFDRLIDTAHIVETLDRIPYLSKAAILQGSETAMGLALRRARTLATHAIALHIGRGSDVPTPPEIIWREQGLPFQDLILEESLPPSGQDMEVAISKAILASPDPFSAGPGSSVRKSEITTDGFSILQVDDLTAAMDLAVAILRATPDSRLGLNYRVVSPREGVEEWGKLATLLAQAAPQGSICAPWPQIAAIDLYAPHHGFETAGEIVTPLGDFPIGLFCLPSLT